MIVIREIEAAEHLEAATDILRENWAETGFDFELAPSIEMVAAMQAAGILFVLGAFADGELVGYSSAMVAPHHFNPEIIVCNSDALFVREAWRKSTVGGRLVLATVAAAKARGANLMLWHTRAGTPFAAMLEQHGYAPADITVMKRI